MSCPHCDGIGCDCCNSGNGKQTCLQCDGSGKTIIAIQIGQKIIVRGYSMLLNGIQAKVLKILSQSVYVDTGKVRIYLNYENIIPTGETNE